MNIVSMPPAPPSKCPVMDLVELMASESAWAPKTLRMARLSILSLKCVEVPWALTASTSQGCRPAAARDSVITDPDADERLRPWCSRIKCR